MQRERRLCPTRAGLLLLAALGTGCSGSGSRPSTTPPSGSGHSVLERNNHPSRDGHFLQPALTRAAVATMARDAAFSDAATFAGNMYASPLYLENGPGGTGVFFAATTDNTVVAIDETSGATVWTHNTGPAPTMSGAGCGNVHPLGIISTPVIDAATRTIFVAGATGGANIQRHELHALSVDDGSERERWPLDVSTLSAGSPAVAFAPQPHNQRSALSLVGGIVYVAYGGHAGDCGPYRGWIVAVDAKDPTRHGAWVTGGQGEGIWAAGGMASDGTGVFAITGNSTTGTATHLDSEEVVRVTGLGTLTRTDANVFYPASWRTMDSADADFGASNPLYVEVPGATPSALVVAIAKDGHLYLLDARNLGGMGGQVVDFMVSRGAMSIHTTPAAYTTAQGVHVVFSTDSGALCPAGGPSGKVIMSVLLAAGAPPMPQVEWCATLAGPVTAPIATTSDGKNDAIVWYMNDGHLTGVDGDTGQVVYAGTDTCAGVRQFTSPIAVKGRIVVGADGRLCSWSPR